MKSPEQLIRALIVEDDNDDAAIIQRLFAETALSITLQRADSIAVARGMMASESFDVILLDLNVGATLSGMDLLKQINHNGLLLPVIIVTGSGDELKAVEAMKSGAYDYLVKDNVTPDLLARAVRGVLQRRSLEKERDAAIFQLAEMSYTDTLTKVANRRRLMERVEEEITRCRRTNGSFSLLMLDLDHFKMINDQYGHQAGDNVLRECAGALRRTIRVTDFVGRYGGEEFCIILIDTNAVGGCTAAEKIREVVNCLPEPMPTVSIGVAEWVTGCTSDMLLSRADKALYEAKTQGRNRVCAYGDAETPANELVSAKNN